LAKVKQGKVLVLGGWVVLYIPSIRIYVCVGGKVNTHGSIQRCQSAWEWQWGLELGTNNF